MIRYVKKEEDRVWWNRRKIDFESMQDNSIQHLDKKSTGQCTKCHDTDQYNHKFVIKIKVIH